jgi:hypothetical protein
MSASFLLMSLILTAALSVVVAFHTCSHMTCSVAGKVQVPTTRSGNLINRMLNPPNKSKDQQSRRLDTRLFDKEADKERYIKQPPDSQEWLCFGRHDLLFRMSSTHINDELLPVYVSDSICALKGNGAFSRTCSRNVKTSRP